MVSMDLPPLEEELPGLVAAYLFGSRARGDATAGSDVDLAVLCVTPLDPLERWKLQERIASRLGSNVDLVDLRSASTVMRARVLADGIVVVDRDPTA
jgi:predicted nucleotidyltransferase